MHNPFVNRTITQTWEQHPAKTKGVDWALPHGDPLPAFAAARVFYAPDNGTAGNTAVLYTEQGYTRYLHCAAQGFGSGWRDLEEGDTVALCGSTGDSTGPHVHVDSWAGGVRVPPFFLTAPAKLDPARRPIPTRKKTTMLLYQIIDKDGTNWLVIGPGTQARIMTGGVGIDDHEFTQIKNLHGNPIACQSRAQFNTIAKFYGAERARP